MSSYRNPMIKNRTLPETKSSPETLDGRLGHPKQPPAMYETLQIVSYSWIFTISAGAGFLPSTVCMVKNTESEVDKVLGGLPLVRKRILFFTKF